MTTTLTPANVLDAHGLTGCLTVQLPPLRARNHRDAVAALKARRVAMLDHADYLAFLAGVFADVPEAAAILTIEARSALALADRIIPNGPTR